jgi:hypothetical protein
MKKFLLVCGWLALVFCAHAQQWAWEKTIDLSLPGYVNELAADDSGNFYLNALDSTAAGNCVVKYNTQGTELWRTYFPGIEIWTLAAGGNYFYVSGNFADTITIGNTLLSSRGDADIFLACYTSDGNPVWARSMGGNGRDRVGGLHVSRKGRIYMTGNFSDTAYFGSQIAMGNSLDAMFVAEYDSSGNLVLMRYGAPNTYGPSLGCWIQTDNIGNIYVGGAYNDLTLDTFHIQNGTNYYSEYSKPGFLCKFDSNGTVKWLRQSNTADHQMRDMIVSGDIYEAGSAEFWHCSAGLLQEFSTSNGMLVQSSSTSTCMFAALGYDALAGTGNGYYAVGYKEDDCSLPDRYYYTVGNYQVNVPQMIYAPDIVALSNGGFVVCGIMTDTLRLGSDTLFYPGQRGFLAAFNFPATNGMGQVEKTSVFSLVPNPSQGFFTIVGLAAPSDIKIYNAFGQVILTQPHQSAQLTIDLSAQSKGIYFVQVRNEEGSTTQKIIIE